MSPTSTPKGYRKAVRAMNESLLRYGVFTPEKGDAIMADSFLALCEAANTPISLGCWLRFKHREYTSLVTMNINPLDYDDIELFRGDYLCVKFLSKYPYFDTGIDREKVAFDGWLASEVRCAETNRWFRSYWAGEIPPLRGPVSEVLHHAQRKISEILGYLPSSAKLTHGRFGPGSDLDTVGSKISSYYKYSGSGSCTPGVLSLFDTLGVENDDRRLDALEECTLTNTSRLTFVPKTAKTDRAICIEPRWNMFFQLGIGDYMSDRLALFGVDVRNQETNKDLARSAYALGLSTIDLSSASDSISKNLVLDLLPDDWSDYLFRLRCSSTNYRGATYKLEKISSMGNGFTFPLETLIFYGLAYGVGKTLGLAPWFINAYGDDLIIPSEGTALLTEVLELLGFSVNTGKSYSSGPFYESCGADFFRGVNVRPIFLKERVNNVERAFRLANQITEFARRACNYRGAHARYMVSWSVVLHRIPKSLWLFGPYGYGDSFIHSPFDRARPYLRPARDGWEGFELIGLAPTPKRFPAFGEGLLFHKLAGASFEGNFVHRRDSPSLRAKTFVVQRYNDFLLI